MGCPDFGPDPLARTSREESASMLSAEQNDLITRTSPGTAAGALLRRYWQPAALVDELSGNRPVKPVRLMGEDLVAFRDESVAKLYPFPWRD